MSVSSVSSVSSGRASPVSLATSLSSISEPFFQGLSPAPAQSSQSLTLEATAQAYWCTSCDTKFLSRIDWYRHEEEFHERYKKYPCPECNRVFWGSGTFNQHHVATHGCLTCPHADCVVRYSRKKKAWGCGICAALLPTSQRFYDHVRLHYESGKTKTHWLQSNVIYGLLHQRPVFQAWKNFINVTYGHLARDSQPLFSWHPAKTGRAPGFLENESLGNLQDLLEFFREGVDDVQKLVQLAHDQADIVTPGDFTSNSDLQQQVVRKSTLSPDLSRPLSCPRPSRTQRPFTARHFSAPQLRSPALQLHLDTASRRDSRESRTDVPRFSLSPLPSPSYLHSFTHMHPHLHPTPATIAEWPELDSKEEVAGGKLRPRIVSIGGRSSSTVSAPPDPAATRVTPVTTTTKAEDPKSTISTTAAATAALTATSPTAASRVVNRNCSKSPPPIVDVPRPASQSPASRRMIRAISWASGIPPPAPQQAAPPSSPSSTLSTSLTRPSRFNEHV